MSSTKFTPYKTGIPVAVRRNENGSVTHILFEKRLRAMSIEAAIKSVKRNRTEGIRLAANDCSQDNPLELIEHIVGTDNFDDLPEL